MSFNQDTSRRGPGQGTLRTPLMWGDLSDAVPGSPARQLVDDGEFLEVDDYDPTKSGQERTKRAS
jgi:hypothetical protein